MREFRHYLSFSKVCAKAHPPLAGRSRIKYRGNITFRAIFPVDKDGKRQISGSPLALRSTSKLTTTSLTSTTRTIWLTLMTTIRAGSSSSGCAYLLVDRSISIKISFKEVFIYCLTQRSLPPSQHFADLLDSSLQFNVFFSVNDF